MKISFRKSDNQVVADIRGGDSKAMEQVYVRYRSEFVRWSIGKFGISEDDALDHYQDTLTIFFEKIMNGSLDEIGSSLKTYLFGIGKNRVRQQFDASSREEKHEAGVIEHYRFLAQDDELTETYEDARDQTRSMLDSLSDNCREILRLFYFEKRSMSEIADLMKHKSEAVSRTTKKRCMEKLRSETNKPLADG